MVVVSGGATERKLAAIMAADVVGFSRQMGTDETGTLARIAALQADVLEPLLTEHRGRLFKTMGDGFLAEFASAVQAVACAVSVQARLAEQADGLRLRIGVHQGDVVVQGEDLMGDGVNIAARLEPLAEPGGIVISARVREDLAGKLTVAAEDLGEQALKNIALPIRVYRIRPASAPAPALALPDKPSLVVLPFANMSGDAEQEYFADGIVEDITTALSRMRSLFVIARNSAFSYKGTSPDIRKVGRELGVRYVLEGSVRKSGNRVRITGQLIEAATGHHIWADRFDGDLSDIFDLQDQITESIVGAIEPSVQRAEIMRASTKSTENLDAYDLYLRAVSQSYLATRLGNQAAIELAQRAVKIDASYLLAKAFLAYMYTARSSFGWSTPEEDAAGVALAREIVAVASDDPRVLAVTGHALSHLAHDYEQARLLMDRAMKLNSNSAPILHRAGWVALHRMDPEPAIENFERSIRISPIEPEMYLTLWGLGQAHIIAGRNEKGLALVRQAILERPNWAAPYRIVILALTRLDRIMEAREAAARLLAIDPGYRLVSLNIPYRSQAFADEMRTALRTSGIPD